MTAQTNDPASQPAEEASGHSGSKRVAVVAIHGMGEQSPMGLIREIANNYARHSRKDHTVWAVADRYDQRFELHTYVVPPGTGVRQALRGAEGQKGTAAAAATYEAGQVDFYEGYWSSDLRGTQMKHVAHFLRHVLMHVAKRNTRGPIPKRLSLLWVPLLVLGVFAAAFAVWAVASFADAPWWQTAVKGLLAVSAVVTGWVIGSVGDVARYLDDSVENVAVRQAIRTNIVGLLERLHDDHRYNRIIVVGHSLGGIVAYDALRLLWARRLRDEDLSALEKELDVLATAATKLASEYGDDPGVPPVKGADAKPDTPERLEARNKYVAAQKAVFDKLRLPSPKGKIPWLVSDFVTVGSPIAYPDLLMTPASLSVHDLVKERELPTCPPQSAAPGTEGERRSGAAPLRYTYLSNVVNKGPTPVFHHAAMFAATGWTNVYAKNDFAGGDVRHLLGRGIVNTEIDGSLATADDDAGWASVPYTSHSAYWAKAAAQRVIFGVFDLEAIPAIAEEGSCADSAGVVKSRSTSSGT